MSYENKATASPISSYRWRISVTGTTTIRGGLILTWSADYSPAA
jgi:hypothetical protein